MLVAALALALPCCGPLGPPRVSSSGAPSPIDQKASDRSRLDPVNGRAKTDNPAATGAPPAASAIPGRPRPGVVRLQGRAFADDEGPFLATGATLFWAVWGWQQDRERLTRNFDALASRGVDYVRVLGVVGPLSGWSDRAADPRVPHFDAAIAGVTDLAYSRGLRVEWTIFGGIDSVPTESDRSAVVDRFMKMAASRQQKIIHWEIANEAWGEGSATPITPGELRRLADQVRRRAPQPVATTAANAGEGGCGAGIQYGEWTTIRTKHLDRASADDEPWRYVLQPWQVRLCPPPPAAWTNNEGKGPGSSVEQDSDPLRLSMYAALTWLAGGAGFVYHSGAGIRGRADPSVDRPADWWDSPGFDRTLGGIRASRNLLPADLPNWAGTDCTDREAQRPFDCDATTMLRMFCAARGLDVLCLPLGVKGTLRLVARQSIAGTWHDALTGAALGSFSAARDERVSFAGREAAILVARRRTGDGK
jgi:hypothetical protein